MGPALKDIAVLGAGSWGSVIALHLARRGCRVRLWEFDPDRAKEIASSRRSLPFLPDYELPLSIEVGSDLTQSLDGAGVAIVVVPSHVLRSTGLRIRDAESAWPPLWVSAVKGIEEGSGLLPSQVLTASAGIPASKIVVLAGPSFALEVARRRPTAVLAASENENLARQIQVLFSDEVFRVYTSTDPRGVEIGSALKNVVAIAAGIAEGLGLGRNALGALITRGLAEITRLGVRLGGRTETFLGLAGIGDLVITATSDLSRNYRVGFELARGRRLQQILAEMVMVAEGVRTAHSARELARVHGVEMPITDQVYAVLYEGRDPRAAVDELMRRPLKPESPGGAQ